MFFHFYFISFINFILHLYPGGSKKCIFLLYFCILLFFSVLFCEFLWISVNFCEFLYYSVHYCEFCLFSDKITEMYKKVQNCTEIYRDVQKSTKIYRDVQRNTKIYNSLCIASRGHKYLVLIYCLISSYSYSSFWILFFPLLLLLSSLKF